MLHHLSYLRCATQPFADADLLALLTQAHRRNTSQNLAGLLVYGNGHFPQVLEGEETAVRALCEHLRQDPRYRDVVIVADKAISTHAFAD